MNFIKFVAQTVILCVALLDGLKGVVELLLEYAGRVPLVIYMAEGGMLLGSMRATHVVAECATGVARGIHMRYPAITGQDQVLIQVLH
jgi:hypothetical protein